MRGVSPSPSDTGSTSFFTGNISLYFHTPLALDTSNLSPLITTSRGTPHLGHLKRRGSPLKTAPHLMHLKKTSSLIGFNSFPY
ncbi:hypothetical protein, partial [Thermogladius sp.]|uniref:hypothetical protein n=1 Tax=Thermogladius sp. TaxID=2023064 RepID=UPI003D1028FD